MTLGYLKEKKEFVSTALLVVSVLSAVLILVKVTGFFAASAKAESAVKGAIKHSKPDSKNVAAQLDKSKKVADALKKSNFFSPPAPKQNPIKMVMGIFGDEALINGKWYKAGAKVADAKILAVNPTSVETEWDGKKKTFYPIDAGASGPGGSSRPGRPTASSRSSKSSGGGSPGMVVTQGPRPGAGGRPMGGGMPGMGGMTRERMMNMSEAERDKFRNQMRERFENMSEAERDKFRQQMRERMGGGRGGDRGGRGGGSSGGRISRR